MQTLTDLLSQQLPPTVGLDDLALMLVIAVVSGIVYFITRWILARIAARFIARSYPRLADDLARHRVLPAFALLAPALIISLFSSLISQLFNWAYDIFMQLVSCYAIVVLALAVHRLLNALEVFVLRDHAANAAQIQALFRLLRICNIALAVLLGLSVFGSIPVAWVLAVVAVIIATGSIVFSDMIYNGVSRTILKGRGLVSEGDWIEIPALQINGIVKAVGTQLIEVQNWDNTLATVPPRYLMNNTFRNWQQIYRVGTRRIFRYIYLDVESVQPLNDEIRAATHDLPGMITSSSHSTAEDGAAPNTLTNAGLYRAYLMSYLTTHPKIDSNQILRVSNEDAIGNGLPLLVVAYATETMDIPYRMLEAEIYEYALAIAPRFGLRIYQSPAGTDLRGMAGVPSLLVK